MVNWRRRRAGVLGRSKPPSTADERTRDESGGATERGCSGDRCARLDVVAVVVVAVVVVVVAPVWRTAVPLFVAEEFPPTTIVLIDDEDGESCCDACDYRSMLRTVQATCADNQS
jgi:hypothetical protein